MENSKVVIGLGLVVLSLGALGVVWISKEDPKQTKVGVAPMSDLQANELVAMKRELKSLRSELSEVKGQGRSATEPKQPKRDKSAKSEGESVDPPELAPSMIPNKAAERRYQVQLEDVVEDESIDASWASSAETQLQTRFSQLKAKGIDVKIRSLKCASTLCKIEIADEAGAAAAGGIRQLSQALPWNGDGYAHVDPDEPSRVLMYVSRDGRALPRPAG